MINVQLGANLDRVDLLVRCTITETTQWKKVTWLAKGELWVVNYDEMHTH